MFILSQIFSLWKGNGPTYLCEIFVFHGASRDFFFIFNAARQLSFPFRVTYLYLGLKSRSVQHLVPFSYPACQGVRASTVVCLSGYGQREGDNALWGASKGVLLKQTQLGAGDSTVMEWGNLTVMHGSFFLSPSFLNSSPPAIQEPWDH